MVKFSITSLLRAAVFGAVILAANIMPPSVALAAPSSGEEASGGGLLLILFIGGGFLLFVRKRRQNALQEARKVVESEIDSHASILRVRRMQTVERDAYGTVSLDKWEKEKAYFIETRILPLLASKGLGGVWDPNESATRISNMIEEAALRAPSPSELEARFISNPEFFDPRMDPVDYEKYCALQLEKSGWKTRLTAVTGDQGADVIADRAGKVLVLQCKLYSSPIGNDAVQQVIAARQFQAANLAAVVSNQPFTRSAKQLADVSDVRLLHHEQLTSFAG